VPGGSLRRGSHGSTCACSESPDLDEFRKIVVKKGKPRARLPRDVADVEDGFEDVNSVARLDGVPLQALGVLKQRGTNAVAVSQACTRRSTRSRPPSGGHEGPGPLRSDVFIEESVH